jgi:hypothetical protein
VCDLVTVIAEKIGRYEASVVRINPMPAPSKQRVLIEFRGNWPRLRADVRTGFPAIGINLPREIVQVAESQLVTLEF